MGQLYFVERQEYENKSVSSINLYWRVIHRGDIIQLSDKQISIDEEKGSGSGVIGRFKEVSRVMDKIFLGSIDGVYNDHFLRCNKIKLVISLLDTKAEIYKLRSFIMAANFKRAGIDTKLSDENGPKARYHNSKAINQVGQVLGSLFIHHRYFILRDDEKQSLSKALKYGIPMLNRKRSGNILVHCYMGYSRSPSSVIAYIMAKNGWDYQSSYEYVNKRRNVYPNEGFVSQLNGISS